METKEVVIDKVGDGYVHYDYVSNPIEYFPSAKVGQTWRVTTDFSAFHRGTVVVKAELIKDAD